MGSPDETKEELVVDNDDIPDDDVDREETILPQTKDSHHENGEIGDDVDGLINDAFKDVDLDDEKAYPTLNGDAKEVTSDVKQLVDDDEEEEEEEDQSGPCGWFSIRPRFIQCLNNPKGYLLFACLFVVAQGMTVNGLIYVVTSTLEKRFSLTSTKSGFISSCYDIAVLIVILFVTYFGENSHKPRVMGTGAFIFAMGSLLFTLPHYLTGYYEPRLKPDITTCDVNGTDTGLCDDNDEGSLSRYYGVFIAAQFLHGFGASPLYTLNIAYLDDNVKPTTIGIYVGIFQAMATLGPAIGYTVGGAFLSMYTDLRVDPATLGLDPDNPLWIGAWWLPFFIPAGLCLLVFIPLLGYPRALPGSHELKKHKTDSGHKGSTYVARSGLENKVRDFPKAMWNLIRNVPYMCGNGTTTTETFVLMSIAVFGPKYIESQFNVTAGTAALIAGVVTIPSALIGCLLGGWLIRVLKLGYTGQIKMCLIAIILSLISALCVFIIQCDNADFAGVTVKYNNTNISYTGESDIIAVCNEDCNCVPSYDPVCGSNDVLYYSPCHAGCLEMETVDDVTEYSNCTCIDHKGGAPSQAIPGKCDVECAGLYPFIGIIFVFLTFQFFPTVPKYTALMRCVGDSQRSFALGINSVLYRLLGAVPGPIVFGVFIDKSCLIWEEDCDGARSCWMYDNQEMSKYFFFLCGGFKMASVLFCIGSLVFYKPEKVVDEGEEEVKDKGLSDLNGGKEGIVVIDEVKNATDDTTPL